MDPDPDPRHPGTGPGSGSWKMIRIATLGSLLSICQLETELDLNSVLRIQTLMIRIRILLFTLIRIRILLSNLIRIRILAVLKR